MKKDNFKLTKESIETTMKTLARNFGFVMINDTLYLNGESKVYMAYSSSDVTLFNEDKSVTFSYDEIIENINLGVYNERTFFNFALTILDM